MRNKVLLAAWMAWSVRCEVSVDADASVIARLVVGISCRIHRPLGADSAEPCTASVAVVRGPVRSRRLPPP